jgi:hypothetical protein
MTAISPISVALRLSCNLKEFRQQGVDVAL